MKKNEFLIQLDRSYKKLLEALKVPVSEPLTTEGTIKIFEFTFKIAIITIHDFLQNNLPIRNSPKDCLRKAFQRGWIDDMEAWTRLITAIDQASYGYSEKLINNIYEAVKKNHHVFNSLINSFSNMCQENRDEMIS